VRAALGLLVVAVVTVFGVLALADATKYRGGLGPEARTSVDFTVEVKHYHHDLEDAAASLWYACLSSVGWERVTPPVAVGGGRFSAEIRPGLPEDARRRFRGCMEDGTVDKVRGDVVRMDTGADTGAAPQPARSPAPAP
jgi:hypothetical protein